MRTFPPFCLVFHNLESFNQSTSIILSNVSYWVCLMSSHDWTEVMHFEQECYKKDVVYFPGHHITGFLTLIHLSTNDVKLDHLVKEASAGFLHSKVTIFPLQLINI